MRLVNYLDLVSVVMLSITTLFSVAHGQVVTAVIAAACAGFVGGLGCARLIIRLRS